ncbi:hypothetical protein ACPA9J_00445 [Pseudomonas aeruginosa]
MAPRPSPSQPTHVPACRCSGFRAKTDQSHLTFLRRVPRPPRDAHHDLPGVDDGRAHLAAACRAPTSACSTRTVSLERNSDVMIKVALSRLTSTCPTAAPYLAQRQLVRA